MTPEERAEKLVLVEAIASSEHTGKYFLRLAGWFAEVLGVSASTNVEGVAKVIRGSIAKAINEALLEHSQIAYKMGLPLDEPAESILITEIMRDVRDVADGMAGDAITTWHAHADTLERWLKTQLEAYRRLLAAMARDNGFQEGYEAGLRAQTKE